MEFASSCRVSDKLGWVNCFLQYVEVFRRRKIAFTIVLKVKETFYTFIHMYVSACFCVEPDTKLKN